MSDLHHGHQSHWLCQKLQAVAHVHDLLSGWEVAISDQCTHVSDIILCVNVVPGSISISYLSGMRGHA